VQAKRGRCVNTQDAANGDANWTPQELIDAQAEIARLREAIRRLADQDATLSVCEGAVTVTMDATLTDAEREAVEEAADFCAGTDGVGLPVEAHAATLRGLLERLKCHRTR
jgi:hypothetical protein